MTQLLNKLYLRQQHKLNMCRDALTTCLIIFCLTQLSGCSFVGRHLEPQDGPPRVDIDVSKIKDAVPKAEAYHPYGTRDYVVGGRRYHVLKDSKGYVRNGYASWYGSKFHGNHTATQERYNLYGMTAASKELPLPSYVEVTNLNNGKKVVVKVNDRGPFHSKRILDVSYAAAKKLGFIVSGVAPVKIVAIDPKTWGKTRANSYIAKSEDRDTSSQYAEKEKTYLQVGAFTKFASAKQLSDKVSQYTDKPAHIDHSSNLYRVQIGPIADVTQSNQLKQTLEEGGFDKVVVVNR